jgi:hypothetical protein
VGAVGLEALDVEVEGVFAHREAALGGDLVLALLDLGVEEFLHPAALQAHQVVVVVAFVELEDGLARFEVMALEEAGLFELGEDPIDGGQADIHVFGDQEAIDVFGGEMAILDLLEQVEDLEPREGCLEADTLEILGIAGHGGPENWTRRPEARPAPYDIVSAPC